VHTHITYSVAKRCLCLSHPRHTTPLGIVSSLLNLSRYISLLNAQAIRLQLFIFLPAPTPVKFMHNFDRTASSLYLTSSGNFVVGFYSSNCFSSSVTLRLHEVLLQQAAHDPGSTYGLAFVGTWHSFTSRPQGHWHLAHAGGLQSELDREATLGRSGRGLVGTYHLLVDSIVIVQPRMSPPVCRLPARGAERSRIRP
jgi:hypothetical protein